MNIRMKALALTGGVLLAASAGLLIAQATGFTRTPVTKGDVSAPGHEAVLMRVEIAPAGFSGWHTHPGDEITFVSDGEATVMVAGQAPHKYKAGEGFIIPAGTVHAAKNESAAAVKLVGTYYVEKGKPLASPAPEPK